MAALEDTSTYLICGR